MKMRHSSLVNRNKLTAIGLSCLLSACGSSSGDRDNDRSNPPAQGRNPDVGTIETGREFNSNSVGARRYPVVLETRHELVCESDPTNPLIGCFVSETCASQNGSDSWLTLSEVSLSRGTRNLSLWFQNSSDCTGNFQRVGWSAFDLESLAFGQPTTGANGLPVTPILGVHTLPLLAVERHSSAWSDSAGRICFAQGDVTNTEGPTPLFFYTESDRPLPTSIDFSNCLLRLN